MKILRYIKAVLIAGPVIVFRHIFYMCRYAKHPEKYTFEKRYNVARKLIRFVFKLLCVDMNSIDMSEYQKMDSKCLMISNHFSDSDPLLLIAASEKPLTFVCKKEVLDFPFVGKIAKALECFPLDRSNMRSQVSQVRNIVSYLKDPNKPSVLIFIEGARNRNPETKCLEFHPGTLKIGQMANLPLLCGTIYGSFRVLDKKAYLRKYPIFFSFNKMISADELKDSVTTELADQLQKETDIIVSSLRIKDKEYVYNLKNSKRRKELETRVDIGFNS